MLKVSLFILIALLIFQIQSISEDEIKHNQGLPSEFPLYKLPVPQESPVTSDTAIIHCFLNKVSSNSYIWQGDVFVDSQVAFSLTIASKLKGLKVKLEEPPTKFKKDEPVITLGTFGMNEAVVPTTTYAYEFHNDKRGIWKATVTYESQTGLPDDLFAHFSLFIENRAELQVFSYQATFKTHVGQKIGLVTRLFATAAAKTEGHNTPYGVPKALIGLAKDVEMSMLLPNGMRTMVRMTDDGLENDVLANDGVYGATIKADLEGSYVAQVIMKGVSPDGYTFLRTTQHLIEVVNSELELKDEAKAILSDEEIQFRLKLTDKAEAVVGKKYFGYAEVWEAEATPLAWISGMTIAKKDAETGEYYIPLHLNLKWLTFNGRHLAKPVFLKGVYVQNAEKNVPLSSTDKMTIKYDNEARILKAASLLKSAAIGVLTEDMTRGKRPKKYRLDLSGPTKKAEAKLVLLHGYCAAGNPFSTVNFNNFIAFYDPNANKGTDAFALKVKEFIEPHISTGVSFISHSQGGMASAHLFSFYWSSADMLQTKSAVNGTSRRIQTVGTPWEGTGIAGSLADLGSNLGFGCGNNPDLTHDGARNWLASIPVVTRQEVYSYITQYADWSWCSLATNLVLEWPNDGVTEEKFSKLEGGNFLGMKKSWCHTSDLKYPAQCTDEQRNKEMNALAARE